MRVIYSRQGRQWLALHIAIRVDRALRSSIEHAPQTEFSGQSVVLCYVSGFIVGGTVLGLLLTALGGVMRHAWVPHHLASTVFVVIGVLFLLAGAREVGLLTFTLPQSVWQVPRAWFYTMGQHVGAFAYGGVLGFGLFTPVVSAGFYAIALWIILIAQPRVGMLLVTVYLQVAYCPF